MNEPTRPRSSYWQRGHDGKEGPQRSDFATEYGYYIAREGWLNGREAAGLKWAGGFVRAGAELSAEEKRQGWAPRVEITIPAGFVTDPCNLPPVDWARANDQVREQVHQWRGMDSAPTDGTIVRLLVDYRGDGRHPLEDAEIAQTIGGNTDGNTSDKEGWKFAGWSWEQDCFTEGKGKPIGWLPFDHETAAPIPMVLHCPACGLQHIDRAWQPGDTLTNDQVTGAAPVWTNPPHKSHQCQGEGCGFEWRPADVPTVGVEAVATRGKNDGPLLRECQVAQSNGSCNCTGECARGLSL